MCVKSTDFTSVYMYFQPILQCDVHCVNTFNIHSAVWTIYINNIIYKQCNLSNPTHKETWTKYVEISEKKLQMCMLDYLRCVFQYQLSRLIIRKEVCICK